MIFKQWQQVLDGTKTQTRRLMKEGDWPLHQAPGYAELPIEAVYDNRRRLRWKVGQTYAVQPGRGKKAIGRIRLTRIRRQRVQDISEEDAKAEGCPSRLETGFDTARYRFHVLWDSIYTKTGERWADNTGVWALTFEVVR